MFGGLVSQRDGGGELGDIERRSTADTDYRPRTVGSREASGAVGGCGQWVAFDVGEQGDIEPGLFEDGGDAARQAGFGNPGIRDHEDL